MATMFRTCMLCFCCTFLLQMKESILLLIRSISENVRKLFNTRGLRCQTRGCSFCMTMPNRIHLMRQRNIWNDRARKFLSTRPTARIQHLRTLISYPTSKNICVPRDSKHMMISNMRCKCGCVVSIPTSIDRV